jgi:cation:H+ antiporter
MTFLLLIAGFVLLVAGGDVLVRGAVGLAIRLGVSPLMIGLTVVGFGTSTPELVTSLNAALAGSPGIALGNIIGSNTANILLILGVAALLYPIEVSAAAFRRDAGVLVLASLAAAAVVWSGLIGRGAGVFLVAGLVAYLGLAYRQERATTGYDSDLAREAPSPLWPALLKVAAGISLTVLGAKLLVDAASELARLWGVSETLIGLTIVAVGTSLPELVTSVVAALRRQSAIAFGNVIGSNIYNILGILGLTAIVQPLPVPGEIAAFDIWVMLASTAALLVLVRTGWQVTRLEGGLLLAAYAVYVGLLGIAA